MLGGLVSMLSDFMGSQCISAPAKLLTKGTLIAGTVGVGGFDVFVYVGLYTRSFAALSTLPKAIVTLHHHRFYQRIIV